MLRLTRRFSPASRGVLASAVVAGTLALSLGVAVPSSSAGESKFCQTILTFYQKYESKSAPPTSLSGYKTWAKYVLPFYEKLAAVAPDQSSKKVLNEVVQILKYESTQTSLTKLATYVGSHEKTYAASAKTLGKDIAACA